MKASALGIKNLQRILPNLIEWTGEEGKNFDDLSELYGQVFGQFNRYMGHVSANVGGVYELYQTYDENKPIYSHVDKAKQREAMMFLNEQLFKTPSWLIDKEILGRVGPSGAMDRIGRVQGRTLRILLLNDRLNRIIENGQINGSEAYDIELFFQDLQNGIFGNTVKKEDVYRRNLQRMYVDNLIEKAKSDDSDIKNTDISAVVRSALMKIKKKLRSSGEYNSDSITGAHFQELVSRIEALDRK